jgi:hypothetical protein
VRPGFECQAKFLLGLLYHMEGSGGESYRNDPKSY